MFEHRQEKMETLLKSDANFRRMYNKHQQLEKRVTAAENGTAPIEDLALSTLKREKLSIKDQLARLMDSAQTA
ncbi:MAG: YdcH family protein [Pseudomonadota bacterium]